MSDISKHSIEQLKSQRDKAKENLFADADPLLRARSLELISAFRAWIAIHILDPFIEPVTPPLVHSPESDEFVYPIVDSGNILAASKAQEMFTAGYSMCKLYYTIEKMIWLLMERMKSGGIDKDQEVQIAIQGYHSALRYAFSSVINLPANVIIVNFDPGRWGEDYLRLVENIAQHGYGYPDESPREIFRKFSSSMKP